MTSDFQAFASKKVVLEGPFVFFVECSQNFRFFPVDSAVSATSGMLGNAGDGFIGFCGGNVGMVLAHTCTETDTRLANVFSIGVAATRLLINSL